ncbi:MAG: hypothetical protein K2X87_00505 [Gemmataceae bacterium]|nr:hypothetical protein [Gemmataceae bacterium]
MAPLRLYLDPVDPPVVHRFVRPGGAVGTIRGLRLIAYADMLLQLHPGPGAAGFTVVKAVIDTGAPLTVIGQKLWQHLRPGVMTPLPFAPATPAAHRTLAIGGGTYPFDLGEMALHLADLSGGRLDVRVVAKFTRDGGRLALPLVLGLRGGLLDGRRLLAEPDPAAPFGQGWAVDGP